jgi:type III restriction enzyme
MKLKNYQRRVLEALRTYFQTVTRFAESDLLGSSAAQAFAVATEETFGRGVSYRDVGEISVEQEDGTPKRLSELRGLPYVCVRVPTGGGKTLIAARTPALAFEHLLRVERGVVLWLVPSKAILEQTLAALKTEGHPYREALVATVGPAKALSVQEALYLSKADAEASTVVIVSTLQSFRVDDTEGRKVYDDNGALLDHFDESAEAALRNAFAGSALDRYDDGTPKHSLANLLRARRPLVIVDEAHNARTTLSFDTLARLHPSCIVEFTATPDHDEQPSNVLVSVSASELKAEEMIRLPLEVSTHADWKRVVEQAVQHRASLEEIAKQEEAATGEYIRPILLLQAQSSSKKTETVDLDVLYAFLTGELNLPSEQVAKGTGSDWELEGVDLMSEECPIRFIITVQKLREGWDCPFAYVLASVNNTATSTAVEQVVGRVLRMPRAKRKQHEALNRAYAFTSSTAFHQTLGTLRDALVASGFERVEANELVRQALPAPRDLGPLGPLFGDAPEWTPTVRVPVPSAPTQPLPEGVTYDASLGLLEVPVDGSGKVKPETAEALTYAFDEGQTRTVVEETLRARTQSPAERGETLAVPRLMIRQGGLYEPFGPVHLRDAPWSLQDKEATLPGYTPSSAEAETGSVDIDAKGQVSAGAGSFLPALYRQLSAFAPRTTWTDTRLILWLDSHLHAPDLTQQDRQGFLQRLLTPLTRERNLTLATLGMDRYKLRGAIRKRISELRAGSLARTYALFEKGEGGALEVAPERAFSYPNESVYSTHYAGPLRFRKHYYRLIGHMNGEETDCAAFLDGRPEVAVLVRNPEQKPGAAFWLPLPNGRRFYPDFVAKLTDGRVLVVEYKGADRYTNDDSRVKRTTGELWAARSEGRCLFTLPNPSRWQAEISNLLG